MRLLLSAALVICVVAVILVGLFSGARRAPTEGSRSSLANGLLLIAGIISALTALIALAAAAWGMDTRLPWGLGIYMYLLPALTLPSFLLLLWIHVRYFARVLWLLTLAEPFAFYFGDKADRLASGMKPLSDPWEIFGMFFNAFTLVMIAISMLVLLAAVCKKRAEVQVDNTIQ